MILLAAGQGNRFAGIKQLADINGTPMLCHCLSQYRINGKWLEGLGNAHVALGANANLIKDNLPSEINIHLVKCWQKGMGHSLSESIKLLANNTTHVLVGLGDQVLITQQMLKGMLSESKSNPKNIIAAKYNGRLGAPAIFPKQYFMQLSKLTGDKGASAILRQYSHQVISVDMPEAAFDIDTVDDLKNVLSKFRTTNT